jgi:hypothetical protein
LFQISFIFSCFSIDENNSIFKVIFIDKKTEDKLGKISYDRKIYADAIKILKNAKAKAIVIKYFFITPKNESGDNLLAQEIKDIPVFLEASVNNEEKNPNIISENFVYKKINENTNNIISGDYGFIPLPIFSKNCFDIGFVDVTTKNYDQIPLIEKFKGKIYKTLWFSILNYIFNNNSEIKNSEYIKINGKTVLLNKYNEIKVDLPEKDNIDYISFVDLIENNFDKKQIENKIIILGYDGDNISSIDTKIGKIKMHRYFYYTLIGLYNKVK